MSVSSVRHRLGSLCAPTSSGGGGLRPLFPSILEVRSGEDAGRSLRPVSGATPLGTILLPSPESGLRPALRGGLEEDAEEGFRPVPGASPYPRILPWEPLGRSCGGMVDPLHKRFPETERRVAVAVAKPRLLGKECLSDPVAPLFGAIDGHRGGLVGMPGGSTVRESHISPPFPPRGGGMRNAFPT